MVCLGGEGKARRKGLHDGSGEMKD
jgi:hypothetical protein